jgi:hypothetical protein
MVWRPAVAIEAAARLIEPGMSELEVAGVLAQQVYASGATPVVALIAADERIRNFRHPAPTGATGQSDGDVGGVCAPTWLDCIGDAAGVVLGGLT